MRILGIVRLFYQIHFSRLHLLSFINKHFLYLQISKSRVHSMKNIFFCIYGMLYANCVLGGPCTILMIFEILSMFIISKLFRTVTSMWITSFVWIAVVQCFLISRFSVGIQWSSDTVDLLITSQCWSWQMTTISPCSFLLWPTPCWDHYILQIT